MRPLTLGDVKNRTRIPQALGICSTDPRLVAWLNEAQQRLITKANWIGTYGRFKICATDSCITMPPQVASIERVALCGVPIPVHDMWYEFLDNGLGVRAANTNSGSACCGNTCGAEEANLRGWFPTFGDIRGTDKKLVVSCDLSADVGKRILVLGYDQNRNWIRTVQGGTIADGEVLLLAQGAGTTSTKFFDGGITGIQFLDDRAGLVWLWELDTVAVTQRLIGSYQYWERNPSYARYLFPSILAQTNSEGGCTTTTVEMIAKLDFIPVAVDTDYLLITNVPALKNMATAVKQMEEAVSTDDFTRAASFEAIALRELDAEIEHYLGEGRVVGMNVRGLNHGGVHPVPNLL